jgi:hypothetical protein
MEMLRRIAIPGALLILISAGSGGTARSATINPALVGTWTPLNRRVLAAV